MIRIIILLLFFCNAAAQTVTDNTLVTAADVGLKFKTLRKPDTDSIFGIKVLVTGDTTWSPRYVISNATTTIAKVTGLQGALDAKQATLVSGTTIRTINGVTVLGSGDLVVSGSAAWGSVTGSLPNQADLQSALDAKSATGHTHDFASVTSKPTTLSGYGITDALNDEAVFNAYSALGSPFKAQTVGVPIQLANTSSNLTDGQIRWFAVYLAKGATLTGIRVYVRVLGSYTPDNNNRIGLYSYSAGTLTQVAASANTGTLWTSAANAFQTIAFSSTYVAAAGVYYVAVLYNQSSVVTAPALASGTALNNAAMAALAFTNSAKLYGTSNATDLPASIAMSSITASTVTTWAALY